MKLDNVIAERKHKKLYRDGGLCAKVFDESFPKSDILNEALNQARVEETGLNIPKIEEVTKIDGKWAIISDYIEGKTLKELMDENPDKIDEYMNLFVDVQLKILSKKCPLLKRLKDKMQDKISQADLDATTRYELHTRLASMKTHNKVCHGDFNPRRHSLHNRLVARHSGQRRRRRRKNIPAVCSQRSEGSGGKVSKALLL